MNRYDFQVLNDLIGFLCAVAVENPKIKSLLIDNNEFKKIFTIKENSFNQRTVREVWIH